MRTALLVALAFLSGCGSTSTVKTDEGVSLSQFRSIAVLPFVDDKGQGAAIAADLAGQLKRLGHEIVDPAAVVGILNGRKPDESGQLSLETLERLRAQTGADAFVAGRVLSDRSAVSATVVETELGDPVIRAVVRPKDRRQAAFRSRDEIIERLTSALMGRP